MSPAAQGPSVLVVEDNSDTRALLERILRAGYTTFAVGDARSALDLLHRERFDALVLDINLGGRETGVDVLRIARSLPGNEALFAIALTAYALPGDRERFLEAGFDQYVSKPFTRATLLTALREGLGEPKV
jgi:CheY-like chemotaxis protein